MRLPSSAEEAEALGGLAGKVRALDPPLPVAVVAVPRGGDAADRGAAAARDIEAGELVCVEEPFAWVPGGDAAGAVCHACASVLGEARPEGCAACEMAVYCSAGCRERHSEVHAAECALLKALPGIAAESGASADLVRIAARVAVRGAVPGGGAERAGRAFRASMADVREMASHVEEQDEERTESMRMAAAMALPLLPLAVRSSTRAADLVTLMSVVNSNAHTVCPDTAPEQALGVGLYPLSSVFNHSCEPNVVFVTEGGGGARLAYRAIRDIAAGEELCVNYVDLCAPTEARRRALLDASHFLCRCDRCEGVPRSADELRRFGNDASLGHVLCGCEKGGTFGAGGGEACSAGCGRSMSDEEADRALEQCLPAVAAASRAYAESDPATGAEATLAAFERARQETARRLGPGHAVRFEMAPQHANLLGATGRFREKVAVCREALRVADGVLPPRFLPLARHCEALAVALLQTGDASARREAAELLDRAADTCRVSCGERHPLHRRALDLRRRLLGGSV